MTIAWIPDVRAVAPGDPAIQAFADPGGVFVTLAYAQMNAKMWTRDPADTSMLDLGARYLAAHMFTIGNKPGGSGGPTESEKVGDVQRALNVMQEDPCWDSTPYGRVFRQLLRTLQIESRWLVVGGSTVLPALPFTRFIP